MLRLNLVLAAAVVLGALPAQAESRVERGVVEAPTPFLANVADSTPPASDLLAICQRQTFGDRFQGVSAWILEPVPGRTFEVEAADWEAWPSVAFYPADDCRFMLPLARAQRGIVPAGAKVAVITSSAYVRVGSAVSCPIDCREFPHAYVYAVPLMNFEYRES